MSLEDLDIAAWRQSIGYVPKELVLFHDSLLLNITLGDPNLEEDDVRAALKVAGAWDFVQALPDGLHTVAGEKGSKISGGQRQRIALSRALATKPKLLILDEVTSALDPVTENDICRRVSGLSGELTILVITHRPIWIEVADCVYEVGDSGIQAAPPAAESPAKAAGT